MGSRGRGAQREAMAAANAAAEEARALRAEVAKKDMRERLKVQRKLVKGIRGKFNPFDMSIGDENAPQDDVATTLGTAPTLGTQSAIPGFPPLTGVPAPTMWGNAPPPYNNPRHPIWNRQRRGY